MRTQCLGRLQPCTVDSALKPQKKRTPKEAERKGTLGAFHNEWEPFIEALCLPVKDAVCQLQEKRETVPDAPGTSGWYRV